MSDKYKTSLDIEIKSNIKSIDSLLLSYGKIKKTDLFDNDDRVKTTDQTLLQDAAMLTKDLSGRARIDHERAKGALLLWCMVYCEKILLNRYSQTDESKEAIFSGVTLGVWECFKSLRDEINKHFASQKGQENVSRFRCDGTVRAFMLRCALQRVGKEFEKRERELLPIKPEEAEKYRRQGICVIETAEGNFYIHRCTSLTPGNPDSGKEFDNPEVIKKLLDEIEDGIREINEGGEQLLERQRFCEDFDQLLKSMYQKAILSDLEMEFIERVYLDGEKQSDVAKDWQNRGEEPLKGTIYTFADAIRDKIKNEIESNEEWHSLFCLKKM